MVRTGVTRAFGASLRKIISKSTGNRVAAFFAGIGVTAVLQSSTATSMIIASFVGRGLMTIGAGLAVMLGADVGTTLVAQVLVFDFTWVAPLMMLTGYVIFSIYNEKGRGEHVGFVLLGLGMMLFALSFIKDAAEPLRTSTTLPLILAPNKGKLSKRKHGEVVSLTTYRDRGFVPAAFRNFLALLGWSPPEGKEILSKEELVEYFSLEGIGRANAIFNFTENDPRRWTDDKALWMNAEYIRTMPLDELFPMVKAELRANKLWREEYDDDDREWFVKTVELIRQRYFTLKDFSGQGRAYFSDDFDFDEAAINKNLRKEPRTRELLNGLADKLESVEPFNMETSEAALRAFAEEAGVKAGLLINGARTMLTGQAVGPSMFEIFDVLGREASIERLRSGIPWSE